MSDIYDKIWNEILGPAIEAVKASTPVCSNGMSAETASLYEEASNLSDEEILEKIQNGEL